MTFPPLVLPARRAHVKRSGPGIRKLHQRTGRKELLSRTVRETEAKAVAFVVCRALGLETTTRSADYIEMYRGNTQTLSDSLEMIQKTAATLIAQLQDESNDSQQEEQRHVA